MVICVFVLEAGLADFHFNHRPVYSPATVYLNMGEFPLARILEFVGGVVPFDTLSAKELNRVVSLMDIAYYPRGKVILEAGGVPAEHLFIIHSGSVKVTVPSDTADEILVDVRGEGEIFGAVSLISGKKALFTVTAREDLLAFLLPADEFRRLMDEYDTFSRHFSFSLARNLEAVLQVTDTYAGQLSGAESFSQMASHVRRRVADLMSANVLTCPLTTTVREVAQMMTERGVGSIIIESEHGPVGLLTDTDLRSRVLATGLSPLAPVIEVMSHPPLTISHQAFAFEAMLEMTRHGVHHLLVTEGEHLVGVVSDHDIKVVTGSSPVGLAREIDYISSLSELEKIPQRVYSVLEMLLRLGSSAEYMMDLLSEVSDRLTLKLFEVTERQMEEEGLGRLPTSYCWLALDDAGRREQAPPSRQTHALIYSDVLPEMQARVKEWFLGFSRRICQGLNTCGRSLNPSGILAKEPEWCRSASEWHRMYMDWIKAPRTIHSPDPGVFLDFRQVQGEAGFAARLREDVWESVHQNPVVLRHLADICVRDRAPLGFLRQSIVERNGSYTDLLDLKRILNPIIGAARIMALEHKISETNTLGRLSELALQGVIGERLAANLREVFNFVTIFRISLYLKENGRETDELVAPVKLNSLQRKTFKESFAVVNELQVLVSQRYGAKAA